MPQTRSQRILEGSGSYGDRFRGDGVRRVFRQAHLHPYQQHHRRIRLKVALDLTEQEKEQLRNLEDVECREVLCPIVGCNARLRSLAEFEDHYNARHMASCSICSGVYPTSRLLGIHVSEAHDSFFQAKAARGYPMYECLVKGCGVKLKSYKSRQQHLIDKHSFPPSFEFLKKASPSKKERLKKTRRKPRHEAAAVGGREEEEGPSSAMQVEDETLDGLMSAVSRLTTADSSPLVVSFGRRRHTRGLTSAPRAMDRDTKR